MWIPSKNVEVQTWLAVEAWGQTRLMPCDRWFSVSSLGMCGVRVGAVMASVPSDAQESSTLNPKPLNPSMVDMLHAARTK